MNPPAVLFRNNLKIDLFHLTQNKVYKIGLPRVIILKVGYTLFSKSGISRSRVGLACETLTPKKQQFESGEYLPLSKQL